MVWVVVDLRKMSISSWEAFLMTDKIDNLCALFIKPKRILSFRTWSFVVVVVVYFV